MFETAAVQERRTRWRGDMGRALVAAEERPVYKRHTGWADWVEPPSVAGAVPRAGAPARVGLAEVLVAAEAGIAALADADLDTAGDRELLDAVIAQ